MLKLELYVVSIILTVILIVLIIESIYEWTDDILVGDLLICDSDLNGSISDDLL